MLIFLTKILRRIFIGRKQKFVFHKVNLEKLTLPKLNKIGIYIHIPFCKSLCPYCPYNRIKYEKKLIQPYLKAILNEINIYYKLFGHIKISSIYIGGGTPTNMIDELEIILDEIKSKFDITGEICIETNISDINEENIFKLKKFGITLISIGVQSFLDKNLVLLGRNYKADKIINALNIVIKAGFKSINIDLMFALPNKKEEDLLFDLNQILKLDINQVTTYPLFTFPYSNIGKFKKIKNLKMPHLKTRRSQYKLIHDFFLNNGFERISVWGFRKGKVPRYSSVTRNYYIGLGTGSASSFKNIFYFNTFSVNEYIKSLQKNILPISIKMNITKELSDFYWFYWKLYDTYFTKDELEKIFDDNSKVWKLIKLFEKLKFIKNSNQNYILTEKGSFWIHLAQNYFILNYINKVWTKSMKTAWPERIEI